MNWAYLALHLFTVAFPLARSFETRVHYVGRWRHLFPAIALSALFFVGWDAWFTHLGVWGFNEDYVLGFTILNLPFEEVLFFITVPFSCVFIYECLIFFFPTPKRVAWVRPFSLGAIALCVVVASVYHDRVYTLWAFAGAAFWLTVNMLMFKVEYQFRFWAAYAVVLVPFLLVNGVLTSLPVVWYNDAENLGIRLSTIPVDDLAYNLFLLLMNLTLYEWFRTRANIRLAPPARPVS